MEVLAVFLFFVCGFSVADPRIQHGEIDLFSTELKVKIDENIHEDASLKVPALVRKYGYPLEEHHVVTADGYILTMHRIPCGLDQQDPQTDRPVVLVMHGLLSSSADWVLMGPGKGLAYILAEAGFDVWLGNARGNTYSRNHNTLDPDRSAFWQFSWDEIGNIDLPNMIDYALKITKKEKLHYMGHSQGTTAFFVMCALRAEYNQKILSMHAMAPVAYLTNSGCLLMRVLAKFSTIINGALQFFGQNEFLPHSHILSWAGEKLCKDHAVTQEICTNILFLIGGWNSMEFNRTMLPVILSHTPAGASTRQFAHYGQVMARKEFRRFNHWLGNYRAYGTLKPPKYDLSKVRSPVFLHYSLEDPLAHVDDVARLVKELGNVTAKYIVPLSSFSHLDFLWGVHAKKLVYDQVITDMKRMQKAING